MSFDKYVEHISQKYRLAVAISVIKTKPEHLSIEDYLLQLQNKIKDTEDPNATVCSDDFNFDDDDIPIENAQLDCNNCEKTNENNDTILKDFAFGGVELESNLRKEDSIADTIRLLKEVSASIQQQPDGNLNLSQFTFCESQDVSNVVKGLNNINNETGVNTMYPKNVNEINFMDSQETQLYSLHGFTQDYTHVSQTEDASYFVISEKFIRNNNNHKQDNEPNTDGMHVVNASQKASVPTLTIDKTGRIEKPAINRDNFNNEQSFHLHSQRAIQDFSPNNKVSSYHAIGNASNSIVKDIEHSNFDKTRIPETYNENVLPDDKCTGNINTASHDKNKNIAGTHAKDVNNRFHQLLKHGGQTSAIPIGAIKCSASDDKRNVENIDDIKCNNKQTDNGTINIENDQETGVFEVMDIDETDTEDNIQERVPFKVIEELTRVKTFLNKKDRKYDGYSTDSDYRSDSQFRGSLKSCSQQSGIWLNQSAHCLFNHIMQATATDDITKEIAQTLYTCGLWSNYTKGAFSALRVQYNNACRGLLGLPWRCSASGMFADSGTDGFTAVLRKRVASLWARVRGSPNTLLMVVADRTDSPMVRHWMSIHVLGKLIDKLHEEENYPQFLEALLETVDSLLKDLQLAHTCADNLLITKDGTIQRLVNLNKSKHVLKYSIEKITTVLEQLHTGLIQDNTYELTHIAEVENTCYIFHVLEIFLKRYMKVKDVGSQSTQNSQDVLSKRSSLTELWRKKWNPNSKEIVRSEIKVCVLKGCSEILNKIIVDCMDGYSLVSFSALQCFNLIQD